MEYDAFIVFRTIFVGEPVRRIWFQIQVSFNTSNMASSYFNEKWMPTTWFREVNLRPSLSKFDGDPYLCLAGLLLHFVRCLKEQVNMMLSQESKKHKIKL